MKGYAFGYGFSPAGGCLNLYLPKDKFDISLSNVCKLMTYLTREGFLENTNTVSFRIFNCEGIELRFNQFTETFNVC